MIRTFKVIFGIFIGALGALAINGFVAWWQGVTFSWDMPRWFLIPSVGIPLFLGVCIGFSDDFWEGIGALLGYALLAILLFFIGFWICAFIGLILSVKMAEILSFLFMVALFAPAVPIIIVLFL